MTQPFDLPNVRLYRLFTIGFNARFYYPILAVLFLDLGLSLSQFVALNAIWAATIFLAEVPSGALADIVGRRKLLVSSAALMTGEMALLVFAPRDAGWWLFAICALNRILSGLAEAAASGADQALAYDSLENSDMQDRWDDVLASVMRWQSAAMVIALLLGAAAYDSRSVNAALGFIGLDLELTPEQTLRLPLVLCLVQAIFTFIVSLRFREAPIDRDGATFRSVLKQTLRAARWVIETRAALLVVIGGLIIDSLARNFATIASEYYRLIQIPEYAFGIVATIAAMLGLILPALFKFLARRFSPLTNFAFAGIWVAASLFALIPAWPYWGAIPVTLLFGALGYVSFLTSRYLNSLSSSKQRATVLSVKGLLFNLGYGTASLLFAGYVAVRKGIVDAEDTAAFRDALALQPWVYLVALAAFLIIAKRMGIGNRIERATP